MIYFYGALVAFYLLVSLILYEGIARQCPGAHKWLACYECLGTWLTLNYFFDVLLLFMPAENND